jgi:homogentisate 1,2-dioxygenase
MDLVLTLSKLSLKVASSSILTIPRTEAIEGALPIAINSPQKVPYGLYTERISGSSFTAPRDKNLQTWMYRIVPSVNHLGIQLDETRPTPGSKKLEPVPLPYQVKWEPFQIEENEDWVGGLHLLAGAGYPVNKSGLAYYVYTCGKGKTDVVFSDGGLTSLDMKANEAFCSNDGDFLIVPQLGTLDIRTELGHLLVRAGEIAVIPRGVRYQVKLPNGPARGFILELYDGHFE